MTLPTLNPHQDYLITEFAKDYLESQMSRRDMLRRVLLITGTIPGTAALMFSLGCGTAADDKNRTPTATASASGAAPSTSTPARAATATGTPAPGATPGVAAADPTIEGGDVTYPGPASQIKGYLAKPKGAGTWPGVIVIHENRGMIEPIQDVARRYAKEGFVALAVDLVSRGGGTGADIPVNTGFLGRAAPDDLVADLNASVSYLKGHPATQGKALGVSGFCFGGGYAFELASANKDIKAAVPYYGTAQRVMDNGTLAKTSAAVYAMYGELDTRLSAQAPSVETALKQSGRPFKTKIWPGASHAFFNNTATSYNADVATQAWNETLAWFRQYLV